MLLITIPDSLSTKITEYAKMFSQTPEELVIEILVERLDHESAYNETAYLAKSEHNRQRLNKAVREIKAGKYETHDLVDE